VTPSEFEEALTSSIERRVRSVRPRADTDDLLARMQRRHSRQRRWLIAAVLVALVAGGLAVHLAQRGRSRATYDALVASSDGTSTANPSHSTAAPDDIDSAVEEVMQAFHDGFDGGSPESVQRAAIQNGKELAPVRAAARQWALAHGFTAEQLAGTSIAVTRVDFVDRTHATVLFTITIPGHGAVITNRVGYAVLEGGRWKVALRTTCNLVSLGGVGSPCPPVP
jgi:hypothetical protein